MALKVKWWSVVPKAFSWALFFFHFAESWTSRYSIALKWKDKSYFLRHRSKSLHSLVTAAIVMFLTHYNTPAENSVSSWISLKVHGLIPSRSHLPVEDQSRQAHTQEERKVVQPVAKWAKIAHEELRGCLLSPTFCSSWWWWWGNIPILH